MYEIDFINDSIPWLLVIKFRIFRDDMSTWASELIARDC